MMETISWQLQWVIDNSFFICFVLIIVVVGITLWILSMYPCIKVK
jgi:hypothetical protein